MVCVCVKWLGHIGHGEAGMLSVVPPGPWRMQYYRTVCGPSYATYDCMLALPEPWVWAEVCLSDVAQRIGYVGACLAACRGYDFYI
jgi:hypothetical protein